MEENVFGDLETTIKQAITNSGISDEISAWFIIKCLASISDELRMSREDLKLILAYSCGKRIEFEQYKKVVTWMPQDTFENMYNRAEEWGFVKEYRITDVGLEFVKMIKNIAPYVNEGAKSGCFANLVALVDSPWT